MYVLARVGLPITIAPAGDELPKTVTVNSSGAHMFAGMLAFARVTSICHSRGCVVWSTTKSICQVPSTVPSHSAWLGLVGPSAWLIKFPGVNV